LNHEKDFNLHSPVSCRTFFFCFSFLQQWEGEKYLNLQSMGPVALSCIFGLAISFFGFSCRQALSATSFTVVGVTNKLLTVLINVTVWSKHAGAFGICMLLVCISGGVLYQVSDGSCPLWQNKPLSLLIFVVLIIVAVWSAGCVCFKGLYAFGVHKQGGGLFD
jgi:hypothetical protein